MLSAIKTERKVSNESNTKPPYQHISELEDDGDDGGGNGKGQHHTRCRKKESDNVEHNRVGMACLGLRGPGPPDEWVLGLHNR